MTFLVSAISGNGQIAWPSAQADPIREPENDFAAEFEPTGTVAPFAPNQGQHDGTTEQHADHQISPHKDGEQETESESEALWTLSQSEHPTLQEKTDSSELRKFADHTPRETLQVVVPVLEKVGLEMIQAPRKLPLREGSTAKRLPETAVADLRRPAQTETDVDKVSHWAVSFETPDALSVREGSPPRAPIHDEGGIVPVMAESTGLPPRSTPSSEQARINVEQILISNREVGYEQVFRDARGEAVSERFGSGFRLNTLEVTSENAVAPQSVSKLIAADPNVTTNLEASKLSGVPEIEAELPAIINSKDVRFPPTQMLNTTQIASGHSIAQQIQHQIQTHLQKDGQAVELRLSPAELGRVRIGMHHGESAIGLVLTVERPETLDLLRRNAEILASEFGKSGFANLSFEFRQEERTPHFRFGSNEGGAAADPQFIQGDTKGRPMDWKTHPDGKLDIMI